MHSLIWLGLGCIFMGLLALRKDAQLRTESAPKAAPANFPRIGVFLILFGLGMSIFGWIFSPPVPASPGTISYSYETFGPGWSGQFRKEGRIWKEYNKDHATGRVWAEAPASRDTRIRLVDHDAIIEIEATTNTIYYTDPARQGYPAPQPIYRIIGR